MATRMGYAAVKALMEGKTNRVIVCDNNMVTDIDIEEGLSRQKDLNQCLFEVFLLKELYIYPILQLLTIALISNFYSCNNENHIFEMCIRDRF